MMMIRMRMMRVVRIMVNIGIIIKKNTTSGLKMKPVQAGAASTGRG